MKTPSSAVLVLAMLMLAPFCLQAADQTTAPDAALPETHGTIVRDTPDALRVEDMTVDELQQRLSEYEAGKRDDRDGYIILHQLWFIFKARKIERTAEAQKINQMRVALLTKHPELHHLSDFRLSGRIKYQQAQRDANAKDAEVAKSWVPPDTKPLKIIGDQKQAVAVYQYRLEFFETGRKP